MASEDVTFEDEDEVYMEEVRDWSVLPADLVLTCAERLDCNVDRANMSTQCKLWLKALGIRVRARQLPWMLVPYRRSSLLSATAISRAHFFCFLSHIPHKLPLPPLAYTVRYIGSIEGGWFVVAFGQSSGYAMLNLHSGVQVDLPSTILAAPIPSGDPMVLRAAALSVVCTF
jgi:hypothetical protein